ncbi:MAG: 50S ribosomal protein L31 [Candidatus Azambacteria bacterium GW2011_GWB1_42_17]|uniref:Large ribosomal subunit protein bL31 n=1 Tax=Candidatus Azambacteria bacterium GW2011_GWB1_42_17 TaxID=1618615 RepID=A0A0G0Z4A6_9BACT|nr:MAG: 50S ribosomal protein L31 [Candidatus Azambacteria bacterium GW2011_GWB1_42_17]
MKKNIHPQYFPAAKAICGCGNKFTVGASVPEIKVEICSKCHPFYTGSQELIDTTGRVERFKARRAKALGSRALGSRNRKKKSKSKA